ncbi:hypothetical protein BKA82DRAFT_340541 [Pisolithus tinctorius]|uniref:Uncharacterized protein n=1 Tax=Pisolithus tinctorius Marx 270 TaxID=870435 RepID=A0A0C3JGL8_PISTI|nr:hypothetical protein BKA82DRAFT_340541 [Pisolithus tinctorius]KIO08203.1 hypothetical protein M404DRAFT_340541 [Pisolithus tinctorius Marx 270]
MKPREYCCCAIPLVNPGIYTTLTEQFVLGIVVGTLSVATPSIVGAATPSVAPWLFAIICYVGAAIQILGFLGVAQEKPILYRRYVTLHGICTCAAFAIAATWTIISAARHSTAQSNCENTFFPSSDSGNDTSTLGQTMCNIFPWVDVGLMGAAWIFFAGVQGYLYFVVSSYGASQREDHEKYEALNDSTKPLTDDIPMADRGDPWDSRASGEFEYGRGGYGHSRNTSTASTVAGAPPVREASNAGYGDYTLSSYAPHGGPEHENSRKTSIIQSSASEMEPSPYTPNHYARYNGA